MRRAKYLTFINIICSVWSLFCCATDACPVNCTCDFLKSELQRHPDLWIACPDRDAEEPDAALAREIDALLANNSQVNVLYIKDSSLTRVPTAVCNLTSLELLCLDDNQLVALPDNCFSRLSRLETFSAKNNHITYLQDGLFDGLMYLRRIDLSNNSIEDIGFGVFSNVSDLPRLYEIDLSNNKLTNLEPWPIIRGQALSLYNLQLMAIKDDDPASCLTVSDNVVVVNLDGNALQSLNNSINWTYNCIETADYFSLLLCLDDIPITDFINEYFTVEGELPCFVHRLRSAAIENFIDAKDPPFSCATLQIYKSYDAGIVDSKMRIKKIYNTMLQNSYEVYVYCSEYFSSYYEHLVQSIFLSAKHFKNLVCHVKNRCPIECECFSTPYNLTLHVLCAGMGLNELPFNVPDVDGVYLPSLYVVFCMLFLRLTPFWKYGYNESVILAQLEEINAAKPFIKYDYDFSGNSFALLEARPYLKNTTILNASNSSVENISVEALIALQQADKIYLHDNLLTTLPRKLTTMNFSFKSFSLHNNPLDCSCDQVWLKNWLATLQARLDNSDGILCATPARLHGKSIFSASDVDFCYEPPLDPRIIASVIVAPLVCITIAIVLLRIFRVESYKRFRFHPFDRDECDGEEMTYDVFISFAHEDTQMARELLEFLEFNGCKVCFHQRDFMAGESVIDNMVEAVHKSKRVICLVTQHFLQSEYCMDEFNIAQTRNVELKKRRLIIMKYEEFDISAEIEAVRTNEGEEQNLSEMSGEVEFQKLLVLNASAQHNDGNTQLSKTLALNDFVSRHTYINLSAADSGRDQLLYAMPIRRLGHVASPAGSGDNN